MNQLDAVERRRRNLRIVLFSIILGTLPLYCLGTLLWLSAPARDRTPVPATTSVVTLQASATGAPTRTDVTFPTQIVPTQGGFPTAQPPQFTFVFPTAVIPPTVFIPSQVPPTATNFVFPTATFAPTLTPFPTETPIPIPTMQPPTITPLPSLTPTETPTPTETATGTEPTPIPFDNP
jgi:type VI secretion system secreted protein VgrG